MGVYLGPWMTASKRKADSFGLLAILLVSHLGNLCVAFINLGVRNENGVQWHARTQSRRYYCRGYLQINSLTCLNYFDSDWSQRIL